ncbi:MAG: Hsp70 family protein [Myxococcota bacterium]
MPTSSLILGIDFGTTNTSAAYFDAEGKLRLVPVKDKNFILPSVVWFPSADKHLVGHAARTQIIEDPKHTVFGSKRFLGRRFQSEYVNQHKDRFAFDIVQGPDGYCAVLIYGQLISLTHVAKLIIGEIAARAAHAAGAPFKECVLTVPAHASVRQREAVRKAAEATGLTVRAIVNEPTAAALYYANLRNPQQRVLIFDLGGGTFDATLMNVENRVARVMATGGDAFLGGGNFDEAVVEHFVEHFERQTGLSVRQNRTVMQRLVFAAEHAKIALTRSDTTQLRVPAIAVRPTGEFVDFNYTLTRAKLEELTFKLVERCVAACDDVLARAHLATSDVDELVMVGGQTRMPAIRNRLAYFKRFASEKDVHPELGVAVGAAILGRNLAKASRTGLQDVVPMPISVMLPGGRTLEAIPANTPVPATKRLPLDALPAWSAPVPLVLFESLDQTSTDREMIGTVHIGPEWRTGKAVASSLELEVGQDFQLKARVVAPGGMQTSLQIVEVRGP